MSADLSALGPLRRRDGEPVFAEPWQAQALAIAERLIAAGCFTAADWAETLGAEIRAAPDGRDDYYAAVLRALERLAAARGLVPETALAERKAAWARAYERTPHGQPVELAAGEES